jgi:hypothetical protein
VAVAFARQGQALSRSQAGNGRGVNGIDLALGTPEAHRFDWQLHQAPVIDPIKHDIQREFAALHSPLHAMPPPSQMDDEGQHRASQAAFGLHQPAGHHGNEDNADTEGGA